MPEVFNAKKTKSTTNSTRATTTSEQKKTTKLNSQEAKIKSKVKQFVEDKLTPFEMVDQYSEVMRQEKPSENPFDAYAPKPLTVYSFDSQLDGEHVLLLLRRHPVTQIKKVLLILAGFLAPLLFTQSTFFQALTSGLQTSTLLFWYLLSLGFAFESFLTFFYNVYIVTDERIIDIDFLSLIYKNVAAAKLDKIEDITAITSGAAQSIFNFGTVQIQTAAERTEFEFELVPRPAKVTQFLNEMLVEEEREKLEGRVK